MGVLQTRIMYMRVLGSEGEEMVKTNGERLVQLCINNYLVIAHTNFIIRNKNIHRYTRKSQ